MSQQWQGPNATWQGPNEKRWNNALEEEFPPLSDEQDDITTAPASPPFSTDDLDEENTTFPGKLEAIRQLGQQFSPILVPLLCGGLTFLFILPLLLTNKMYVHAEHIWPIALILLALAIVQGTILYYAGSNPVFWWLGVAGSILLFLLAACFTVFGPIPTVIFLVTVVIACFISARLYMRPVPEGTVDIVYSFGKYTRTLYPGLNFLLPWEWVDSHLQTREKQWVCPEQTVQISRDEDVHLKAVISYQLMPEDAYLAVTRVDNWEESLQTLFALCLQQASNELKPEDFIASPQGSRKGASIRLHEYEDDDATRWARVSNLLFQRMRDRVANWGVLINWVHIRDITLTPRASLTYDTDQMAGLRASSERTVPTPNMPPQAPQSSRKNSAESPVRQQAPAPATPVTFNAGAGTPAAAVPSPPPAARSPKEEALITAYRQIQSEKIKSPATIREVASRFLAIANDPEASKHVSFDAARAAQALYTRADFFEKQASLNEVYEDDNTPTQVDWPYPRSEDGNYTSGG